MASIRRALSPVPRPGALRNGEACSVASPLSKSSSCSQNYPLLDSPSALCKTQDFILSIFSQRSSRPLERSKSKGQNWKRASLHFFVCFALGFFLGFTPFVPMNLSRNLMSTQQAFSFEVIPPHEDFPLLNIVSVNNEPSNEANATLEPYADRRGLRNGISDTTLVTQSLVQNSSLGFGKLLIIVTPTYARPFQAYYLNRLAHTLKLVPSPLLWIVVEMTSQSDETTHILRRSGLMYRHLVCTKNLTEIRNREILQRNVALLHIETHRLDGIVYFADDDNAYSLEIFEQMRLIRRFGTWSVAKLAESKSWAIMEGPICSGSQVIGWHTSEITKKSRRFHAEMSGFAFNSTILWDPRRWHRPTLETIRQIDTVKEDFQTSMLMEQLVEDESQMEGLMNECSEIMVWHLHHESPHSLYPQGWFMKKYLDVIAPLA